jgi:hypothetical protein
MVVTSDNKRYIGQKLSSYCESSVISAVSGGFISINVDIIDADGWRKVLRKHIICLPLDHLAESLSFSVLCASDSRDGTVDEGSAAMPSSCPW